MRSQKQYRLKYFIPTNSLWLDQEKAVELLGAKLETLYQQAYQHKEQGTANIHNFHKKNKFNVSAFKEHDQRNLNFINMAHKLYYIMQYKLSDIDISTLLSELFNESMDSWYVYLRDSMFVLQRVTQKLIKFILFAVSTITTNKFRSMEFIGSQEYFNEEMAEVILNYKDVA